MTVNTKASIWRDARRWLPGVIDQPGSAGDFADSFEMELVGSDPILAGISMANPGSESSV